MNTEPITLIASTFRALVADMQSRGLSLADITRSPVRINGTWRCEVRPC